MPKKEKSPLASAPLKHTPFAGLRAAPEAASPPEPGNAPARAAPAGAEQADSSPSAGESRGRSNAAPPPADRAATHLPAGKSRGRLVQRRETKHRAGKAVIVVSGFEQLPDFDEAAVAALAKELKQALGCGGTLETRAGRPELVLQGDRPAQVAALLRARGFRVDGVSS